MDSPHQPARPRESGDPGLHDELDARLRGAYARRA